MITKIDTVASLTIEKISAAVVAVMLLLGPSSSELTLLAFGISGSILFLGQLRFNLKNRKSESL